MTCTPGQRFRVVRAESRPDAHPHSGSSHSIAEQLCQGIYIVHAAEQREQLFCTGPDGQPGPADSFGSIHSPVSIGRAQLHSRRIGIIDHGRYSPGDSGRTRCLVFLLFQSLDSLLQPDQHLHGFFALAAAAMLLELAGNDGRKHPGDLLASLDCRLSCWLVGFSIKYRAIAFPTMKRTRCVSE